MSDKRLLLSKLGCVSFFFFSFLSFFFPLSFFTLSLFLYFLLYTVALFALLSGVLLRISPIPSGTSLFFSFLFCFSGALHLHPAALWCCCLGAGGQKSLHQLDLRMGLWGSGGGGGGGGEWIKNQSNWNGVWRRRTPCETVNHVPLLNMGQEFTVVIAFLFSFFFLALFFFVPHVIVSICLFVTMLVHAFDGTVCSPFFKLTNGATRPIFHHCSQVMWKNTSCCCTLKKFFLSVCWPLLSGFFSVTVPCCSVAPCSCGGAVITPSTLRFLPA